MDSEMGASTEDSSVKPRWPKACGCGETWTREHWGELTPIGRYQADEWIELRTCVCGKTLAVPTSDLGDETTTNGNGTAKR